MRGIASMVQNKGAISRTRGDKGIRETWARCEEMSKGRDDGTFFAPWEAIAVNERLLPRHIDAEVVQRYAGVAAELPPITVQRETYVLIDGLHRLRAAPKAGRDMILVREVEVPDDGLALAAFEANLSNGLPYTLTERVNGAKLMLRAHPEWSNTVIGQKCGIDPDTVSKHRHRLEAYAERTVGADGRVRDTSQIGRDDARESSSQQSATHRKQGSWDGGSDSDEEPRAAISMSKRVMRGGLVGAPVSTFEPEPEPEPAWEEPSRQVEESEPEATCEESSPVGPELTPAESARAKFDELEARQARVAEAEPDFVSSSQVVWLIKTVGDLAQMGDEHSPEATVANMSAGQRGYLAKLIEPALNWLGRLDGVLQ